jgi:hypothetical protein
MALQRPLMSEQVLGQFLASRPESVEILWSFCVLLNSLSRHQGWWPASQGPEQGWSELW